MPACPVCGEATVHFASLPTPYLDRAERYEIRTCVACGHGVASGRCDADYLARIYSDEFHRSSQQDTTDANAPVHLNARQRVKWLRDQGFSGSLLDVGAGKGAFVEAAASGFKAMGIELSEAAAAEARQRGLELLGGDFLSAELPDRYDVVTMWDVLASFHDPRPPLERTAQLLRSGGIAVVTLPMIDSVVAKLLRRSWPLAIPPVNLHYFTRRSIALLAEGAGMTVANLTYPAKRVALNFLLAKAGRSVGAFRLARVLGEGAPNWAIPVNTGDIACAILRRA